MTELRAIPGVGEEKESALREAGYNTVEEMASASRDELLSIPGIGPAMVGSFKALVEWGYFEDGSEKR